MNNNNTIMQSQFSLICQSVEYWQSSYKQQYLLKLFKTDMCVPFMSLFN